MASTGRTRQSVLFSFTGMVAGAVGVVLGFSLGTRISRASLCAYEPYDGETTVASVADP
ncbi:MAG: hypothetical protein ACE5HJ_09025 [Thermoplasmata archaeon]